MSVPFFMFPGGPSREEIEQATLSHESFIREVLSFLGEDLNQDQMFTLLALLQITKKSNHLNGYFAGIISGSLTARFDLCFCRGTLRDSAHTRSSHFEGIEELDKSDSGKAGTPQEEPDVPESLDTKKTEISDERRQALEDEYKLAHSDQPGDPRVQCRRCGMQYPSLADRMLRGPGECSGCEQAEKSGAWLDRWA